MKKLLLLAFIGTWFCLNFAVAQSPPPPPALAPDYFPEKWKEFTFVDYGFSIRSPEPPKKTIELAEANAEGIRKIRISSGSPVFVLYDVTIRQLSATPANEVEIEEVFDRLVTLSLGATGEKNKLIKKESLRKQGFPARSFEIEQNGKRLRTLLVLRGRAVYAVTVLTRSNDSGKAFQANDAYGHIANGFLDSFQVLGDADVLRATSNIDEADRSLWKEYIAENDGFKSLWPGTPSVSATDIKLATRTIPQVAYRINSPLMGYSIVVQNHSVDYKDKDGRDALYNSWRDAYSKSMWAKIISDKAVLYAGNDARAITVESEAWIVIARATFKNGRFYAVAISYTKADAALPALKKVIDASADSFLDSVVLTTPKSMLDGAVADLNLPAGFFGDMSGGMYTNNFFKFRIKVPDAWLVSSSEENRMMMELSSAAMAAQNPDLLQKLKSPEKAILNAYKKQMGAVGNASFLVDTIRETASNIDLEATMKKNEGLYGKMTDSRITRSTEMSTRGGHRFGAFERVMDRNGVSIKQRVEGTLRGNYVIYFIMTWIADADRETLLSAMSSFETIK